MLFVAYKDGKEIGRKRIFSIGGGSIRIEGEPSEDEREVYPQKYFTEILNLCKEKCITLPQLIYRMEDPSLKMYLDEVWKAMQDAIHRGLEADRHAQGQAPLQQALLQRERGCGHEPRHRCLRLCGQRGKRR